MYMCIYVYVYIYIYMYGRQDALLLADGPSAVVAAMRIAVAIVTVTFMVATTIVYVR